MQQKCFKCRKAKGYGATSSHREGSDPRSGSEDGCMTLCRYDDHEVVPFGWVNHLECGLFHKVANFL